MNPFAPIVAGAIAFLIGSIPTAYLVIRAREGKDLRAEGSGNVGARNAFEVSRSRAIGIGVFAIDALKGATPVIAARVISEGDVLTTAVAMLCVVLGHNYPPWLRFRGGRGLAPAAGAALAFDPVYIVLWGTLWYGTFRFRRDILLANIVATLGAALSLVFLPAAVHGWSGFIFPSREAAVLAGVALCGIIFLRHVGPLRAFLASRANGISDRRYNRTQPTRDQP
jgi:glycerol-3-phosphate acyltransferase PlsY